MIAPRRPLSTSQRSTSQRALRITAMIRYNTQTCPPLDSSAFFSLCFPYSTAVSRTAGGASSMTVVVEPASLTITQVAQRLGVHPKTIYRLVEAGQLPAVKVGRLWRVPLDLLLHYEQG